MPLHSERRSTMSRLHEAQRQRLAKRRISQSLSMSTRTYLLVFALWLGAPAAAAQGQTSTPAKAGSADPAALPTTRDSHQGLLVAADPYTSSDRYKEKFGKHTPYEGGLIAIDLFFRNDNDLPI